MVSKFFAIFKGHFCMLDSPMESLANLAEFDF